KIGSVLGYLFAGVLIGPFGIGFIISVYEVESILHIAELGVVFLLFLIGLELKPQRLIAMRKAVFGAGALQLIPSSVIITLAGLSFGLPPAQALIIGLALGLSSTAFVLQVLDEKQELRMRHGRLSFSILLFQDLAAIPIIALVPALAVGGAVLAGVSGIEVGGAGIDGGAPGASAASMFNLESAALAIGMVAAVILIGRFVLGHVYSLVARSGVREAMTGIALLTVMGVSLLMTYAGLSAGLGAFIVGALLADSEYRHQIEADLSPFEGLLLGLFFIAIGMSLNLQLLAENPVLIGLLTAGLLALKGSILYFVGLIFGLGSRMSRRMGLAVSQGGEFAFVILTAALATSVVDRATVDLITVIVVLSMIATPILLLIDEHFFPLGDDASGKMDDMPDEEQHVVIAGFGRFAQIPARILSAKGMAFTALETSAQQVDFVRQFGNKVYYGDPTRLDVLHAADVGRASAFVVALDDPEKTLQTVRLVKQHFPHVPVYARAKDRRHAHELMELGVEHVERETFHSALELTTSLLNGLGYGQQRALRAVEIFRARDQQRLLDDFAHFRDAEKIRQSVAREREELETLFRGDLEDAAEQDDTKVGPRRGSSTATDDAKDQGTIARTSAALDAAE
ncbi:MAG: cation:proton antiporter, partial [Pseudomonadota bacterium]